MALSTMGSLSLLGCGPETPTQTDDQVTSFKGTPMPPEVRAKFEREQAANQGPPPGTPTGP